MRVGEDEAGQGDLLGLGLAERVAPAPDDRVEALRQGERPLVRVDGGEGGHQALRVGARAGEQEVVGQGAHEDVVLLGDESHLTAQVVELEVDQRNAPDGHRPRVGTVDACHEAAEGRLPGARGPTMARRSPGTRSTDTPRSTSWPLR